MGFITEEIKTHAFSSWILGEKKYFGKTGMKRKGLLPPTGMFWNPRLLLKETNSVHISLIRH